MSTQVRFRRGTAAAHATFTGAQGEVTFDTDGNTLRAHDNVTAGGWIIATQAWVSSQIIAGVADGSLTPAKFANTAQNTFLGRITSGSGAPAWLTATQARQGFGSTAIGDAMFIATDVPAAFASMQQAGLILFQARNFR